MKFFFGSFGGLKQQLHDGFWMFLDVFGGKFFNLRVFEV